MILPKLKSRVSPAKEQNSESIETKPEDDALLSQIFDNEDDSGDCEEPNEKDNGNPVEAL
jgi:hypothetical protein